MRNFNHGLNFLLYSFHQHEAADWGLRLSARGLHICDGTECGRHMRGGHGVLMLPERWTEAGMLAGLLVGRCHWVWFKARAVGNAHGEVLNRVCRQGCEGFGAGREKARVFARAVRTQQQAPRKQTNTHIHPQRNDTKSTPTLPYIPTHTHTHTSVSLLRFHRSKRPMPSTAAKMAGCTGDHMTSYT